MATLKPKVLGCLIVLDDDGNSTTKSRKVSTRHEFIIGRDTDQCQWAFQDPHMSRQHLRIYIVSASQDQSELEPLVYAEDISRNGVYWNGSLIGNKSHAFLLSDGDRLRLTSKTSLKFEASSTADTEYFPAVQEREMRAFCSEYVITDRLIDTTLHSRRFMAIEQRSRHQVACEIIKLDRSPRTKRYRSTNKRPISASDLDFQHEVRAVKSWVNDKNSKIPDENKLEKCFRISKMLHSMNHPNLLSLEKILVTDNNVYIFQELVPAGNLLAYVASKNGRLLELEAAIAIRQILSALKALHEKYVVHRNIQPTSILVSTMAALPRFVLSSFELARMMIPLKRTPLVSDVRGPEISRYFTEAKADARAEDLRCIGATAAFLLTGSDRLFHSSHTIGATRESHHELNVLPTLRGAQSLRPEAIDFINHLTDAPEQESPKAQEAMNHVWLSVSAQNDDVKQLCEKAVQFWKPALSKDPFIDFVKDISYNVRHYACSQKILEESRPIRGRSTKKPVEAPYKPFYREIYHMANAGDRAARTPRHLGSEKLRSMSADWKRNMSSSPSPTRVLALKEIAAGTTNTRHDPEANVSHQQDQSTITLRPRLTRQTSFQQRIPKDVARTPRISSSPYFQGTALETAPSVSHTQLEERIDTRLEESTKMEKQQPALFHPKEEGGRTQKHATGLQLKSRMRSPPRKWALNVRSGSRLNARTPTRASSPVTVPKQRDGRSIFDYDSRSERGSSTTTPPANVSVSGESLGGTCVTPHMAHLRLA